MTGFAVTYTIKDEARLLPDALRWHRALGCERFYIFLDGTTDAMREWLPTQNDVVMQDSAKPAFTDTSPKWLEAQIGGWDAWIDARKNINSWCAAQMAADESIEWLANIDPDELILPDPARGADPEAMAAFLAGQDEGVAQVLLPNCDVLPDGEAAPSPFAHRHFQARFPALEMAWKVMRKPIMLAGNAGRVARFDQWFWDRALGDDLPRRLVHPATGATIPAGYFLSYASHKVLFRTHNWLNWQPVTHQWERHGGSGKTVRAGAAKILHFDMTDADSFLHKFGQRRGNREERPRHFATRRAIGDIALDCREADARKFFDQCLAVSDPARIAHLVERGVVLDLPQVAAFFEDTP